MIRRLCRSFCYWSLLAALATGLLSQISAKPGEKETKAKIIQPSASKYRKIKVLKPEQVQAKRYPAPKLEKARIERGGGFEVEKKEQARKDVLVELPSVKTAKRASRTPLIEETPTAAGMKSSKPNAPKRLVGPVYRAATSAAAGEEPAEAGPESRGEKKE